MEARERYRDQQHDSEKGNDKAKQASTFQKIALKEGTESSNSSTTPHIWWCRFAISGISKFADYFLGGVKISLSLSLSAVGLHRAILGEFFEVFSLVPFQLRMGS